MRRLAIALVLLSVAVTAQAQIRVAIENGGVSTASAANLAAQLNDDTYFDFTATVVAASQIDSLAELNNYDVVILGDSGYGDNDWNAAMASALRSWVEAGHGAVLVGWGDDPINLGDPDAADLEAIFPGQNIPAEDENVDITDVIHFINGPHPVTSGLTDFAPTLTPTPGDSCCIEIDQLAPEANDTVLATDSGATGANVMVKSPVGGSGRSVYLGLLYMAQPAGYPDAEAAVRAGQADRLLEQAVAWAAGANAVTTAVPALSPLSLLLFTISLGAAAMVVLAARH